MTTREINRVIPFVNIGPQYPSGCDFKFRSKYKVNFLNENPSFGITGEGMPINGNLNSPGSFCGCCHEMIEKFNPEIAPLIKWHLCFMVEGPMHYVDNALYFLGLCEYKDAYNLDVFKKHIKYGTVEDDENQLTQLLYYLNSGKNAVRQITEDEVDEEEPDHFGETERQDAIWKSHCRFLVRSWLEKRLPRLLEKFEEDIKKYAPGLWEEALEFQNTRMKDEEK